MAKGKKIVEMEGGDTEMECFRTSIRKKANSVKCFKRRNKEKRLGFARRVANEKEKGLGCLW